MIKIEKTQIFGWEAAIRGARNPMNSWNRMDSMFYETKDFDPDDYPGGIKIGPNDLDLMQRLVKAGKDHSKFMRMIHVQVDVTAPLYWWKEYDTYKVATTSNSCSTMHKIHAKEFTLDDFAHDKLLTKTSVEVLNFTIMRLNNLRDIYLNGGIQEIIGGNKNTYGKKDKDIWYEMIQLLPSSYLQKRTLDLNYATLREIWFARKRHKLNEWRENCYLTKEDLSYENTFAKYASFCNWIKTLPYAEELIMVGEE